MLRLSCMALLQVDPGLTASGERASWWTCSQMMPGERSEEKLGIFSLDLHCNFSAEVRKWNYKKTHYSLIMCCCEVRFTPVTCIDIFCYIWGQDLIYRGFFGLVRKARVNFSSSKSSAAQSVNSPWTLFWLNNLNLRCKCYLVHSNIHQ